VWHVDITTVGIGGLSLPWIPFALPLLWPFAWHVALVVDHFSRAVIAFGVFGKEPSGKDICALLDRGRRKAKRTPRHIVTDHGSQFQQEYLGWCEEHGAKPRFGAIGKHGSIAVIERFIRSLKYEHLFRVLIPCSRSLFESQIAFYAAWYNEARAHQTLGGLTPSEKLDGKSRSKRRLEPRPRIPIPRSQKKNVVRCDDIELVIHDVGGCRHLPVIELRVSA
jgi:transposase InsO family protein